MKETANIWELKKLALMHSLQILYVCQNVECPSMHRPATLFILNTRVSTMVE